MRPREYEPETIVELCREEDGLTTSELADRMDARLNTTWYRCQKLEESGRLSGWRYGIGQHRSVTWHVVDEE